MTREELQKNARLYVDAWQRHDAGAIALQHTADGVVESPIYSTLRGRKAIEDAAQALFTSFPDATFTVDAVVVDAPHVALFMTTNATHVNEFFGMAGTNRHIEVRSAFMLETNSDGRIVKERRIYDFTGLLLQVGFLRAKPAKP
jgi:steroid delta-isomerase-like uncharacterized protein